MKITVGEMVHDINRREWLEVKKVDGDTIKLESIDGRYTAWLNLAELQKMIDASPLNHKSK